MAKDLYQRVMTIWIGFQLFQNLFEINNIGGRDIGLRYNSNKLV